MSKSGQYTGGGGPGREAGAVGATRRRRRCVQFFWCGDFVLRREEASVWVMVRLHGLKKEMCAVTRNYPKTPTSVARRGGIGHMACLFFLTTPCTLAHLTGRRSRK